MYLLRRPHVRIKVRLPASLLRLISETGVSEGGFPAFTSLKIPSSARGLLSEASGLGEPEVNPGLGHICTPAPGATGSAYGGHHSDTHPGAGRRRRPPAPAGGARSPGARRARAGDHASDTPPA